MALVQSAERVTVTLAGGVTSATANIAAADISQCIPFVTSRVTALPAAGSGDQNEDYQVDVEFLTAPNRVRVSTTEADAIRALVIEVGVIEFTSEVVVQSGAFLFTSATDLSKTATLSPTVTYPVTKAFALAYYKASIGNNNRPNLVRTELTAANTITFTRDETVAADQVSGHYWVAEAAASQFSVQQCRWQMGIGADVDTTKDFTITSVGSDTTKTMVIASIEGDGNALADDNNLIPVVQLLNTTTLRMQRQLASSAGIDCTAFVVTFSGAEKVQRGVRTQAATPPTDESIPITTVALAKAMAWGVRAGGCCSAAGTSAASGGHPDAYVGLDFENDSLLRIKHLRQAEPGPMDISWEVVEWDTGAAPASRRVFVIT